MHTQAVTGFATKRLWNRALAGLLSGCLVLGASTVSQGAELPVTAPAEGSAEPVPPVSGESVTADQPAAQGAREGRTAGRTVAGGLGAVILLLGTGLSGAGIYLAANKGSASGSGSDLAALSKSVFIPTGLALATGGLVIIGAVVRHRTR